MKSYRHLRISERSLLGRLHKSRHSIRSIARSLGVSPSTVLRELKRNWSGFGYCCNLANDQARSRRTRINQARAKLKKEHLDFIENHVKRKWSPAQVASQFPRSFGFSISPRTIYRFAYSYSGYLRQLRPNFRRKGRKYLRATSRLRLGDRPMIDQRPSSVNDRVFYGDWEADLMEGPRDAQYSMVVLVERKSKFTLIQPVQRRTSAEVSHAIKGLLRPFKVRTITYDNGTEFAQFESIATSTNSKPYFCHPYRSWEKGIVENTIGLLREYYPKKYPIELSSFKHHEIQDELNRRPRETLEFRTPESFHSLLAKRN